MKHKAQTYKKTMVETASKEKILLMLYEGAIKYAKLARIAIGSKNVSEKCKYVGKVHDIVMELSNSLDHKKAPEFATQLEGLYDFCIQQLLKANLNTDATAVDSVIKVLTTLHEGWVAAVADLNKKRAEQV